MQCLAVGDIHGCFIALQTLVDYAPYEQAETVVFLGDYIDRGPQSRQVLDWMIQQQGLRKLHTLRGNHDIMMLQARDDDIGFYDWLYFGGNTTLLSYGAGGRAARLDDVPDAHWNFLEATRPIHIGASDFFVHAVVDPLRPLDDQPDDLLYWEKLEPSRPPHMSGKRMICGHTSQKNGQPLNLGHTVCIDTWVYGDGWLTALDVSSGRFWQANEVGQTREGQLQDT